MEDVQDVLGISSVIVFARLLISKPMQQVLVVYVVEPLLKVNSQISAHAGGWNPQGSLILGIGFISKLEQLQVFGYCGSTIATFKDFAKFHTFWPGITAVRQQDEFSIKIVKKQTVCISEKTPDLISEIVRKG